MMHPDTTVGYINEVLGLGIIATKPIPKGTIIYVYDSLEIVIPPDDPRITDPLYSRILEHFSFTDKRGNYVVCWDHGRYMNHCCHPNTMAMANECCIAIRDIAAGEELKEDYGLWRVVQPMGLICDNPLCRKYVSAEDNPQIADRCDTLIKQAILQWRTVPQALLPLITPQTINELDTYVQTGTGYVSVRTLLNDD